MKLLSNKKGFLFFEVVIVFIVFSFISILSLTLYRSVSIDFLQKNEINVMINIITEAKHKANNENIKIEIIFFNNEVNLITVKTNEVHKFNTLFFSKHKELYFNNNGNFNKGQTIYFKQGILNKKLIIYLGKGGFVVE